MNLTKLRYQKANQHQDRQHDPQRIINRDGNNESRLMRLLGIALITFGLAACSPANPLPTPQFPSPSPRMTATATSIPTPTGTPDRAKQRIELERLADQLLIEADSVAAAARRFEGGDPLPLDAPIRHYVPLYLTTACIRGRVPSVEDFRVYANNSIAKRTLVDREAVRIIREIIGADENWRNQSLEPATQNCLRPYLYPESVAEARPAIELYLASSLPSRSALAKSGFEARVRETAGEWFQTDRQKPYIAWLCGGNC